MTYDIKNFIEAIDGIVIDATEERFTRVEYEKKLHDIFMMIVNQGNDIQEDHSYKELIKRDKENDGL